MAFWSKKKEEPAVAPGAELHDSSRPGVGSDPAPYVPDDDRSVYRHVPVTRQWTMYGVGRSGPYDDGVPFQNDQQRWRKNTNVLYAVQITDDGHSEYKVQGDPYERGAPEPLRPRRIQTTYRELAQSVQPFGGFDQRLNGTHFSMADNVRTYPIGGMTPVVSRRNTYRLMPPPVDINSADVAPSGEAFDVPERVSVSPFNAGIRSFRSVLRG